MTFLQLKRELLRMYRKALPQARRRGLYLSLDFSQFYDEFQSATFALWSRDKETGESFKLARMFFTDQVSEDFWTKSLNELRADLIRNDIEL